MVTRTRAEKAQPWLESPVWDCFWIFSGLWLLVIVLIAHGVGYIPLISNGLAMGAMVLLWGGHILAPVIVIWTNRAWRAYLVKNKRQCILLPLALLLMSVTLGMLGDGSQWPGMPREIIFHLNPRLGLFYMFLLWNTWHFSAQHFGVLAIYRRVSGQFSQKDRCFDRAFCVGMTCVYQSVKCG